MRVLRWIGTLVVAIVGLSACREAPAASDPTAVAKQIRPTAISINTVTPTGRPIVTPTPAGRFPAPPADWLDAPAAITEWLNQSPDNPPLIRELIDEWYTVLDAEHQLATLGYYHKRDPQRVATADLDGDGSAEIVITMLARAAASAQSPGPGVRQLMVFSRESGRYEAVADTLRSQSRDDPIPMHSYLWRIVDLTSDGRAEIITDSGDCGAHTCLNFPGIWQWSTAGITDVLIADSYDYTQPDGLEPKVANTFAEFSLADEDQDGVQELRFEGGGVGSVGGGTQRRTVSIYVWDGAAYRLDQVEYADDDSEPFWSLIDAARLFRDGEYADADKLYRAIMDEPKPDDKVAIPYSAVARASRFQLMLTSLLLGQPEEADRWRNELTLGGDQAWGDLFWGEYERSGNIRAGCMAAAAYADSFEFKNTGYDNWRASLVTCVFR